MTIGKVGLALKNRADPVVAEILEQEKTLCPVHGERARREEAAVEEMAGHGKERPDVLIFRRGVHQDGALLAAIDPEIAPEARVSRQRPDLGAVPAMLCEEIGRRSGRNHRGGHRASQAAGTPAVKARAPSPCRRRVRRSE